MKNLRKIILFACAAALLAAACGDDDDGAADADGARSVTLVLDWTPNTNHGGIYAAEAEGFYADVGIDLRIIQPGDSGGLQALGTGNAEFAISVQESLIPARAEGVPVVSVAAIIEDNTSSLLALADSGIVAPADLEDHRYGGFGGPLEVALVDRLVECDGGDPSAVDFVDVGNVDYRVGLENGNFDFVWVFDAWDTVRLGLEGVAVNTIPFIDHEDCIPNWYTPLIATREDLISDDPALVADFMAATAKGYRLAMDDPATAATHLLAAAPELDEDLVRASADYLATRYAIDPAAWGQQDPAVWATFGDFLVDAGLLSEAIDPGAAFTNEFLTPTDG